MDKIKPKRERKSDHRNKLGRWGEAVAASFLQDKGFVLLDTNFRTPDGELDLVVQKGEELVFVEVKTRQSTEYGMPEEAVNDEKLEHLEAAAGHYLLLHPEYDDNWHLDVITVIGSPAGKEPQIDWFENVTG